MLCGRGLPPAGRDSRVGGGGRAASCFTADSAVVSRSKAAGEETRPGPTVDTFGTLKTSSGTMPLLHQDNSRGGGGPSENRRSLAEFRGLEPCFTEPPPSAPASARNECMSEEWWESPSSPAAAQSPRALVPANCFPPVHPRAYASYSESAQPGRWYEDPPPSHGITDLVNSLKALAIPGGAANGGVGGAEAWAEPAPAPLLDEPRAAAAARRSSFCESVSGGPGALCWAGSLPARCADPAAEFSPKLFLGGLPWDIAEDALLHALRHFSPLRVEWPGQDEGLPCPRGFAYVTLESGRRVRALLAACRAHRAAYFYKLHSRKRQPKDVEVIPWAVSDANWVCGGSARLAAQRTVFVGALHGMLSAHALATIMNDLFGGVVYAGIDTDKNKYPIGSGRVTFDNVHSYVRAISAAYVDIQTDKFSKKVQVNPYLEDSMCSVCNLHQGPYFCREPTCFGYFCRSCWSCQHPREEHKPLTRTRPGAGAGDAPSPATSASTSGEEPAPDAWPAPGAR